MKLFFILFLFFQFCFSSETYFGDVYKLSGKAFANKKQLKISDKVYVGDTISTKENTKLLIKSDKGVQITLGENSSFTITKEDEVDYKQGKSFFNFISKQLRETGNTKFNIKLKSASMGIRGTNFIINSSKEDEKVLLRDGKLEIKNNEDKEFALYNKKPEKKDGVDAQKEAYKKYSNDFNEQFAAYKRKDQYEFEAYVKQFDITHNTQLSFGDTNDVYKEPLNIQQLEDAFGDFDSFSDFSYKKTTPEKLSNTLEDQFNNNELEDQFNSFDTKGL